MNDRARTLVFRLLAALLVWGVVELAAVVGHAVLDGRLFSPSLIGEQARAVAARSDGEEAPPDPTGGGLAPAADRVKHRWVEVIHPYFGVVLDPNRHPAGVVSDLGFRDSQSLEPLLQADPETTVIAVFGGSFAGGVFRQGITMPVGKDDKTLMVNFAKGGYKQPQQLMILAYLLAVGVQLDVVVNVDGFNEVALPPIENVPRGVNPFYPRQWHLKGRGVIDPAVIRRVGYLEYLESQRSQRAAKLVDYGLHRSAVASLVWRALDRKLGAEVLEAREQVELADTRDKSYKLVKRSWRCLKKTELPKRLVSVLEPLRGRSFESREELHQAIAERLGSGLATHHRQAIDRCTAEVSESYAALGPKHGASSSKELYRDLVGLWQRTSLEMNALCKAYGIRYYHFLQPNQYVEGSKPMSTEELRIAINKAQNYRSGVLRGYPLLREAGRELTQRGVTFVDLTMMFENDRRVLYTDDCCHLNKRGYATVVEKIFETLAADA